LRTKKIQTIIFWGTTGSYLCFVLTNHTFYCPTRTKIKILWRRRYFSEVPSLRKEILTIKLHVLLLGNFISLH